MIIEIFGLGCSNCERLMNNAQRAVDELGIEAQIIKVEDFEMLIREGITMTPGLVIDGEIRSMGRVPSVEEIKEMIETEKMASIGQVSAWIAHQIRNSLSSILMAVSALSTGRDAGVSGDSLHRGLTRSIAKLDHMVSDLLDYSRTLQLHPTSVYLGAVLDDLLATLMVDELNKGIHIERIYSPLLPRILADVFKLEHAFGNVLKNAMQAMSGDGQLRVEAHPGPGPREVTVVITDSGVGIVDADLLKVFLPFFSTKSGGTGLGLAMTARIIEAHGGSVSVESVLGEGATFIFVLPVTVAEESQA